MISTWSPPKSLAWEKGFRLGSGLISKFPGLWLLVSSLLLRGVSSGGTCGDFMVGCPLVAAAALSCTVQPDRWIAPHLAVRTLFDCLEPYVEVVFLAVFLLLNEPILIVLVRLLAGQELIVFAAILGWLLSVLESGRVGDGSASIRLHAKFERGTETDRLHAMLECAGDGFFQARSLWRFWLWC